MKYKYLLPLIALIILAACSTAETTAEQASSPEPTHTAQAPTQPPPTNTLALTPTEEAPTETLAPTPTEIPPTPTPTPLPEGIIFRDDFDGYFQPGWTWMNEEPDRWSFVTFDDSRWLLILGDKPGNFEEQKNTLMRALPEGDFVITAHIIADPRQNFHQANIFIFEDPQNYIRLNFGFCQPCLPDSTGHGYFMETIIENNPFGDLIALPRNPEEQDVYLRLVNFEGSITGYYATELDNWQKIGSFGNYFDFVSVGIGATNSVLPEMEVNDIEALFDYFEIAEP
jgi:hypothetical protein